MKRYHLKVTAILAAVCVAFPLPALFSAKGDEQKTIPPQVIQKPVSEEYFRVKDKSGGIINYSERDYILGVVAAEMPASYSVEALKAQTVAAYTIAVRRRNIARKENADCDIVADSTVDQAFYPIDETAKKWGADAEIYKAKIEKAVDSVLGEVITYDSQLIDAVFFAISNGKTEDAINVWGNEIPYLKSVDSAGDITAKGYLTTVSISTDDFKAVCDEEGIKLGEDKKGWIGKQTLTNAGQTKSIVIGDKTLSGKEVRSLFSLRSATFAVALNEDTFTFTVRGYGHGVGMSQFGANYMSELGADYKEILCWYYKGCEIKNIQDL
ncbi:MAG: stage II sporulation protein D [Clostridia bacterium]|nr:stage II sporulation protein D [Clostridia bacterium]